MVMLLYDVAIEKTLDWKVDQKDKEDIHCNSHKQIWL